MDHNDHTTNNLKGKHLTYGERVKIEIWLEEGHNPSWIAKKLGRAKGTIYAAVKNGMTEQIRQGKKRWFILPTLAKQFMKKTAKTL